VITFPNCKINLGLNIIRKRPDGFHDIETIFYPVRIYDILEIIPASEISSGYDDLLFTTSGTAIDGDKGNNLCVEAYHLLKKDFPSIPAAQMHLHKTIPIGAGLGGGSADASFALKLLNKTFDLQLSDEDLIAYSDRLGSDCPFFILNKPCFASGTGEILEPVAVDLRRYKLVLINPGIHINTGAAFSQVTPALPSRSIKELIQSPVSEWKKELINDFEAPVFKQYPEIAKIKDELYNAGAVYASLSGSGSTVYGIFEKDREINLSFPKQHYYVKIVEM